MLSLKRSSIIALLLAVLLVSNICNARSYVADFKDPSNVPSILHIDVERTGNSYSAYCYFPGNTQSKILIGKLKKDSSAELRQLLIKEVKDTLVRLERSAFENMPYGRDSHSMKSQARGTRQPLFHDEKKLLLGEQFMWMRLNYVSGEVKNLIITVDENPSQFYRIYEMDSSYMQIKRKRERRPLRVDVGTLFYEVTKALSVNPDGLKSYEMKDPRFNGWDEFKL